MVTRQFHRLMYECTTPSVWMLVGAPVTLAFDGMNWIVSMMDRDGFFREGRYLRRDDAMMAIGRVYDKMGTGEHR